MGAPQLSTNSPLRRSSWQTDADFSFWGQVELPEYVPSDTDDHYTWTQGDRIDLLAKRYYGDSRLKWVILWANDLDCAETQLYLGRVIQLPTRTRLLTSLLRG